MYHISPSLLCADQLDLRSTLTFFNSVGIDWYHIDVMDGNFVPNFAIGTDCLQAICRNKKHPVYAHVMAAHPEVFIRVFADLGVDYYCFHYETTNNPFRLCQEIAANGMKPAIALNPSTPISVLNDLIPYLDAVTLMAIEPGFSGQKFLPFTYQRITELKNLVGERALLIEVDGGADNQISHKCIKAGCDVVVGGRFNLFCNGKNLSDNYDLYLADLKGVEYDN